MHRRFRRRASSKLPLKNNKTNVKSIINSAQIQKGGGGIEGFLEYQRRCRNLHKIREKYKNKIELNKEKLAQSRIFYFTKKYILRPISNLTPQERELIPGKYLMRVKLSDDNLNPTPQPISFKLLHDNNSTQEKKLERRPNITQNKRILNQQSRKFLTKPTFVQESELNSFYAGIDIRIYGKDPYKPIIIDNINYYLNPKQIKKVRGSWIKTYPETPFKEKYRDLLEVDTQILSVIRIQRFIKKTLLYPICNLDDEQLSTIPGLYLMRLMVNNNNLTKPMTEEELQKIKEEERLKILHEQNLTKRKKLTRRRNIVPKQETDLEKAIRLSIEDNSQKLSSKDIELNNVIIESLQTPGQKLKRRPNIRNIKPTFKVQEVLDNGPTLYIGIDLRVYGIDPSQPIYCNDIPYYLDFCQISKINNTWTRINPDKPSGLRYAQNIAYQKAVVTELNKQNIPLTNKRNKRLQRRHGIKQS